MRLAAVAAALALLAPRDEPTPLELGVPLELEVPIGEPALFEIEAGPDEYVELTAERPFGALTLRITDADGALVRELAGVPRLFGALRVGFLAESDGPFRLGVTSPDAPEPKRGRFRLELVEHRPAETDDPRRIAALEQLAAARTSFDGEVTDAEGAALTRAIEQLVPLFQQLDAPACEASVHDALNDIHYVRGATKPLLASAEAGLAAWRKAKDRRAEGRALSQVGLAAYVAYDRVRALESYRAALAIHDEVGDVEAKGETLERMGWYHRWRGDRNAAVEHYRRALPLRIEAANWPGEIVTRSDLGLVCLELGDVAAAREHLEQAVALTSPERDRERLPGLLSVLGIVLMRSGEFGSAAETFHRGIDAARAENDRRNEAALQNNLGVLYDDLGDAASARRCLERALELSRSMGQRNGEAAILSMLARLCSLAGDAEAAERHARQALALSREIQDPASEASALRQLSYLAIERGDLDEALDHAQRAHDLLRSTGSERLRPSALVLVAEVHARREEWEQAIAIGRSVVAQSMATKNGVQAATMHLMLAQWELDAGRRDDAVADARAAVAIAESLRRSVGQADWRASFSAASQEKYEVLIEALLAGPEAGRPAAAVAEAFSTSERARARSLLELLRESKVDVREGVDRALLATEADLRRRLDAAVSEERRLPPDRSAEPRAAELVAEIELRTAELREIEARIRATSPRFAELVWPEPLTAAQVQHDLLDEGTLLLEWSLGARRSWLFAVTTDGIEVHELPPATTIEAEVAGLREALLARAPREDEPLLERQARIAAADAAVAPRASTLAATLLGPIATELAEAWRAKRLVLVAPGALQCVPFAALAPGRELVVLPSASVLAAIRRETAGRAPAARTLAIFADPVFEAGDPRLADAAAETAPVERSGSRGPFRRLPFSRQEARDVAALVPESARIEALDFDASLARVRSGVLADCRVVHFATHAVLDDQRPELSGLVLSLVDRNGAPQDGFLDLDDVCNLRLRADLVTLSACQSALGREVRGEGLIGLTRGFMYAGAGRVVASLWHVDDLATAELMRRFYVGCFEQGRTAAAALAAAQSELSRTERFAAPWYWAGFVLQGDWR